MKKFRSLLVALAIILIPVLVWGSATLVPYPKFRAFDSSGAPLSGGLLYSYEAGTTTPKATYTDQTGAVANTNPVVLDSNGEANVWMNGQYKLVLKDSDSVTLWTIDNIASYYDSLSVSAYSETVLDDTSASAWLTTLGFSDFAKTLIDDTSAALARKTLGVGTLGTQASTNASITGGDISGVKIGSSATVSVVAGWVKLNEESNAPSTSANQGALYTLATASKTALFYRNESNATPVQVTSGNQVYLPDHNHKNASQGGDYPWADITGFGGNGSATTVLRGDHLLLAALIQEVQAQNTPAGGSLAADWNIRKLNTEGFDGIGVSVSSGSVVVPPGKYLFIGKAPAYSTVNTHFARFYLASPSSTYLGVNGSSHRTTSASGDNDFAWTFTTAPLPTGGTVQLHHYTQSAIATNGLGLQGNIAGTSERYSEMWIIKVGDY